MLSDEKVQERGLEAYNVMLAAFLAGLNEMGMLNQASVNVASRRSGRYLAEFARLKTTLPEMGDDVKANAAALIEHLNSILTLSQELSVESGPSGAVLRITGSKCRFCPKGVGEAELEGTLCPYPGLVVEFVNALLPEGQSVQLVMTNRKPMSKTDAGCVITLQPKE